MDALIYPGLKRETQFSFRRNLRAVKSLTPEIIIDESCVYFKINKDLLLSNSRMGEIVEIRKMVCFCIRKTFPNMALTKMGELLNRDHSTIIYNLRTCANLSETEAKFNKTLSTYLNIFE